MYGISGFFGKKGAGYPTAAAAVMGYLAGILTVCLRGGNSALAEGYLDGSPRLDWLAGFCAGPLPVMLVVFCGFCLFGWLLVLPLIFYKTFGLGYTAGLLVSVFGAKGFLILALCLFPSAAAECFLLIRSGGDAIPQSVSLFRMAEGDPKSVLRSFGGYALRGLCRVQCTAFVFLWDLFFAPWILSGLRNLF